MAKAKKEFAPTGFVEESGMKLAPDLTPGGVTSSEKGNAYNKLSKKHAESLPDWGSEEIFTGTMDLVGLYGHEKGKIRTFRSTQDMKDYENRGVLGERGLILCQTGKGSEGGVLPVGGTETPVDLEIIDTFMWAHEGDDTPVDRRTRRTTLAMRARPGGGAVLAGDPPQPFIPVYDKQADHSGNRMTKHGMRYHDATPYYSPDMQAEEVEIGLEDGKVSTIKLRTRSERDEGYGKGVIVVSLARLAERQRQINDKTAKGPDLNHDRDMRIYSSVSSRVRGMLALIDAPMQKTKEKRVQEGITRVAAKAAQRLDLLPEIEEPAHAGSPADTAPF